MNLLTNGRNDINFTLTNSQIARDAAPSWEQTPHRGRTSAEFVPDWFDQRRWCRFGRLHLRGTRAIVSQDALQEFQIITNGFAAEDERSSGEVVNIVTKSGENRTHASGYGFMRNRNPQATNPFSNVAQPAYTRNLEENSFPRTANDVFTTGPFRAGNVPNWSKICKRGACAAFTPPDPPRQQHGGWRRRDSGEHPGLRLLWEDAFFRGRADRRSDAIAR